MAWLGSKKCPVWPVLGTYLLTNPLASGDMLSYMTQPNYNAETMAAIQEARDIASGKIQARSYSSTKEMIEELDADDTDD